MSKQDYEQLLPEMEALDEAAVKTPNMPVDAFVQEAADLEVWSVDDQPALRNVGVSAATFSTFSQRIGALRYAQSLWMKDRYSQEEARQEWEARSPEAESLKDELEHTFRFAFRDRPDLISKIQTIESGNSNADMVQDLSDLSVLGQANLPLLNAINFEVSKLEEAANRANEMGLLLAAMNGERTDNNNARIQRDRAFTLLKENVDEIREAGKFIFWKDERRLQGYSSSYFRRRRTSSTSNNGSSTSMQTANT